MKQPQEKIIQWADEEYEVCCAFCKAHLLSRVDEK